MRERTVGVAAGALVGYLLYGAAATVLFVYWNFPFDRLEQWGVAKIAQTASLRVVPHERHVRFPLFLQWDRVGLVGVQGGADHVLQGEHVSIDLALLPLLNRTVSAAVRMHLLGGEVAGVVEWKDGEGAQEYRFQGRAWDLELSHLENGIIPVGRLHGDWDYRWGHAGPLQGQGLLTVELKGVKVGPGLSARSPIPPLTFREVSGRIALSKGVGTVEDIRAEGPAATIWGTGSVILQSPLEDSLLNLNLQVGLREATSGSGDATHDPRLATGQYRFIVKGTIRQPAFYLNDASVPFHETRKPGGKA